jgi:endonuclease/exonuclease/phosphatase family metal-dependent hydrolase
VATALAVALSACGGNGSVSEPGPEAAGTGEGIEAVGTPTTLDLGTWNLEWFGDVERGPTDEALQLSNAELVLEGLDVDLWSVQEMTDGGQFDDLVSRIDGFEGFLADDPIVDRGAEFYRDFEDQEQKVGLLYRSSAVTVTDARVILTERDWEFAGRPPVEVELLVNVAGTTRSLVVIVLHAKAGDGVEDWERRSAASEALEAYLETTWPTTEVAVLGDFNDDVDVSISGGRPSSYDNLVADPDWTFLTAALSTSGRASTVFYPDVIDHILVSDELLPRYVDGSVEAVRVDAWLSDYGETTSDHYPVVSRFRWAPAPSPAP